MKAPLLAIVLAAAPQVARADGMIRCSNPDDHGNGNCSAADSTSVGSSLLLLAGVAYGIGRRKRR